MEIESKGEMKRIVEVKTGNWWKVLEGTHLVQILKEPNSDSIKRDVEYMGKTRDQIELEVKIKEQGKTEWVEKTWTVTYGGKKTVWAQITAFAIYCNEGKYVGKPFTLIIIGSGMQRKYNVHEALIHMSKIDADFKKKEVKEEKVVPRPAFGD